VVLVKGFPGQMFKLPDKMKSVKSTSHGFLKTQQHEEFKLHYLKNEVIKGFSEVPSDI
jgi:hypothetical protein